MSSLESLECVTLLSEPVEIIGSHKTSVWHGSVLSSSSNVEKYAYIKILPIQQLISESICAVLGRAIGLPIPKPFLVMIRKNSFEDKQWEKVVQQQNLIFVNENKDACLAFASEDEGHPSFSKITLKDINEFRNWVQLKDCILFDEWIANPDRHLGNILYEGQGKFSLIDHSHALTSPNWQPYLLKQNFDKLVGNYLLDNLKNDLAEIERYQWRKYTYQWIKNNQHFIINNVISAARLELYADNEQIEAVDVFISNRLNYIGTFITGRLNIPELDSLRKEA